MSMTYTGGCACRALRYTVTGAPIAMLDCQCRQCQRDSGTGHQSHMVFAGAEVVVEGPASHWQFTGDAGTLKDRAFCPTCGSAVALTFPAMPQMFSVTAASLDDPGLFQPQFTCFTEAAQAWDRIDPALPAFARMPPR